MLSTKEETDTIPFTNGQTDSAELRDFTTSSRVKPISALAIVIGALCAFVALALLRLIGLFTSLFYFGRWSTTMLSPAGNHLGLFAVLVRIGGALISGITELPVIERESGKLVGLVSLASLLKARTRHLEEEKRREQVLSWRNAFGRSQTGI